LNGTTLDVPPGPAWLEVRRKWIPGDSVELFFDMGLRFIPGDREALGRVSLYRGPLLLAFDPRHNAFDDTSIPALDLDRLDDARVVQVAASMPNTSVTAPWLLMDVPAANGRTVRLSDFATAGVTGRRYRSWLPVSAPQPPPPITRSPADGAIIGQGSSTFRWTSKPGPLLRDYQVIIVRDPDGRDLLTECGPVTEPRFVLDDAAKSRLPVRRPLWWKVVARGPHGSTASQSPLAHFVFDPAATAEPAHEELLPGPDALAVHVPLQGDAQPRYGRLERSPGFESAPGPDGAPDGAIRLNGRDQMLVYALPEELGEDYSASVWVRVNALPEGRIGQILSLWAGGMDDPLRLTVDRGKLYARIEARQNFSTGGVTLEAGSWRHVAAVKAGAKLTLYLDGKPLETIDVPAAIETQARICALGGNPNYSGNECLAADFARFELFVRALRADEVARRASGVMPGGAP
jgi:hypothetical protein